MPTATPAKHFTATSQHHNNHLVPLKPGWDPHPSLYPSCLHPKPKPFQSLPTLTHYLPPPAPLIPLSHSPIVKPPPTMVPFPSNTFLSP